MRKLDAFAHILPPRYLGHLERQLESTMPAARLSYYREGVFRFDDALTDLDVRRRRIEAIGDYAQVLVLAVPPLEEVGPPGVAAELARRANDEMAELVVKHPDLFAGFTASLPLSDIEASLREMERAIGEHGALGIQMFTNVLGMPLDDARLGPIWELVERLDRTVWLHPTRNAAHTDYSTEVESNYGLWWSLGWPYETAAALSRLVFAGMMDRHDGLKVLAHHGAGMVPHFSSRLAMGPGQRQVKDSLPSPPLDYFRRFFADTALFGAAHAVRCVLDFFGPDHVLFGTDTPLGPPRSVEDTIADIEAAGLSDDDRAAVYSGNAARVLGI